MQFISVFVSSYKCWTHLHDISYDAVWGKSSITIRLTKMQKLQAGVFKNPRLEKN